MYAKQLFRGKARFSLNPASGVHKVAVAGTFSNWKPIPMPRRGDGSFGTDLTLQPGSYEYRFIVDEKWISDPDNCKRIPNPYGATNSVAHFDRPQGAKP